MSGRSGYRKTARKNPRRSMTERRHAALWNGVIIGAPPEVRMAFLLPKTLEPFISQGQNGQGVTVLRNGFVRVSSRSAEQCFRLAQGFFGSVAKDRPAFTVAATLGSTADTARTYGRHLTIVRGCLVVSTGPREPVVFEAA